MREQPEDRVHAFHPRRLFAPLSAIVATLAIAPAAGAQPQFPPLPDPVPVTVDAATTALLVLDFNSAVCTPRPSCIATLPSVSSVVTAARAANVLVIYSTSTAPGAVTLPEAMQLPGDPEVTGRADKFFRTDLEDILASHNIKTVVLMGTAANGAALYTSFGATVRGMTVVAVDDAMPGPSDISEYVARWQILNQPGSDNPENEPLREGRVTLSRSDLISFK